MSPRELVDVARATPRRLWTVSFVIVFGIGLVWAVTTPRFGAGDEPSHVVRAVALADGVLIGEERPHFEDSATRIVQLPLIYQRAADTSRCFWFEPSVTPDCFSFSGPSRRGDTITYSGPHPPAYYAFVGYLSAWASPGRDVDVMRVLTAALCAALLASSVVTLSERRHRRLLGAGMLVALTPTALYMTGIVNTNGPAVAASVALWLSGLALATGTGTPPGRLVARAGLAAGVLALTREDAPFWLALILLALLALSNRDRLGQLLRERIVRIWGVVVGVCVAAQVAWLVAVQPFDRTDTRVDLDGPVSEVARLAVGEIFGHYRDAIGIFGFFWDRAPSGVIVLWTVALGALVVLAVVLGVKRATIVTLALIAAIIVIPTAVETYAAKDVGLVWQGRYNLLLGAGVPIVAAYAIAASDRFDAGTRLRLARLLAGAFVVGQVAAYFQQLRRYTVGRDGTLLFLFDWKWSPPAPPWLLFAAFVVLAGALAALVVAGGDDLEAGEAAAPAVSRGAAGPCGTTRPARR